MTDLDPNPTDTLRNKAEEAVRSKTTPLPGQPGTPSSEADRVVWHELQVHQIELEMQNEELRRVQAELELSHARYFDLYDLAPVGYVSLSEHSLIVEANLSFAAMLGLPRSQLVNQPLSRFILPENQDIYYQHRLHLAASGMPQSFELRLLRKDAEPLWVKLQANQSSNADGSTVFRLVAIDISERKHAEQRLRLSAALFENASEGFLVTDAEERIIIVNEGFVKLTGYSAEEVLGSTPRLLQSGRQDLAYYQRMWAEINVNGRWQGEIWNRRKNGEIYPQMLSIGTVHDELGKVTHYIGIFSDISQLKEVTAKLEYQTLHDALTGLPNRLLLFTRLQHCIDLALREPEHLSILMLDLDHFKDVNDSFGHLAGDELLQQVAGRMRKRLRSIDTVSRLGGDEFAILLEDSQHPQDAALVAREIIDSLGEPFSLSNGVEVRIGVSVGISLFPEHGKTPEELLQQADSAMFRAKTEGRGSFKYFTDDMTQAAQRRINLESLLRRAIAQGGLRLHYQPQIDIASGRIVGAESLVRLVNALEGLIPPGQFIPVAEETGLIAQVGEWVLRETCRQGQEWIAVGMPALKLSVNVSAYQLRHGDLSATVATVLAETGFPAERLELELTESALMEREEEAVETLQRCRALGVHLAIDDFGTGYSSLAYLKRFPLDTLKIDKRFIDDVPQLQDDKEIVSAVVGLGHTLRLKVLAEGVETPEQLEFLTEQGCDLYQGYLFSPPVPAAEFAGLMGFLCIKHHPDPQDMPHQIGVVDLTK